MKAITKEELVKCPFCNEPPDGDEYVFADYFIQPHVAGDLAEVECGNCYGEFSIRISSDDTASVFGD